MYAFHDEDQSRVRRGYADQNLALVRRIALSLLKRDTTTKAGIKARRLRAACDDVYLRSLLGQYDAIALLLWQSKCALLPRSMS